MPYLLYKAVLKDKKYGLASLYIFLGVLHVYFVLNYSGQSDLMWRVNGNLEYLIQDFERSILRVLANRKIYVILVGLVLLIIGILYAEGRKEGRKEGAVEFLTLIGSLFLIIFFIDFTKLPMSIIDGRYCKGKKVEKYIVTEGIIA